MTPAEKVVSLNNYVNTLKNRLSSPPNEKHKNHPEALQAYLKLEIKKAERTIEKLRDKVVK